MTLTSIPGTTFKMNVKFLTLYYNKENISGDGRHILASPAQPGASILLCIWHTFPATDPLAVL